MKFRYSCTNSIPRNDALLGSCKHLRIHCQTRWLPRERNKRNRSRRWISSACSQCKWKLLDMDFTVLLLGWCCVVLFKSRWYGSGVLHPLFQNRRLQVWDGNLWRYPSTSSCNTAFYYPYLWSNNSLHLHSQEE